MNIIVVTPPPVEPVTVEQVYEHLRWDADEGSPTVYPLQGLVERNITVARQYVEQTTRRALVKQTLRMVMESFPYSRNLFRSRWGGDDDWYKRPGDVYLLRPPFINFLSVQYLDKDEVLQTLDPANYYIDSETEQVPILRFRDTFDVDIVSDQRTDAVRIEWVAGYPFEESPADFTSSIPAGIKEAILLQIQLQVDRFNPDERRDLERARDSLLASYTIRNF